MVKLLYKSIVTICAGLFIFSNISPALVDIGDIDSCHEPTGQIGIHAPAIKAKKYAIDTGPFLDSPVLIIEGAILLVLASFSLYLKKKR